MDSGSSQSIVAACRSLDASHNNVGLEMLSEVGDEAPRRVRIETRAGHVGGRGSDRRTRNGMPTLDAFERPSEALDARLRRAQTGECQTQPGAQLPLHVGDEYPVGVCRRLCGI